MKPTFPLLLASTFLAGCSGDPTITSTPDSTTLNLQFKEVSVPESTEQKFQNLTSTQVTVNGENQSIGYHPLFKTGDQNNGEIFGLIKDVAGQPLKLPDGSPYVCNGTNDVAGSGLDHVSILQKNDKLFMVSQYECAIGAFYLNELEQDSTGLFKIKPDSLQFIDQSADFGGFVHCAGQTTPWQSHLGSEEYEPDARFIEANYDPATEMVGSWYFDATAPYWQGDLSRSNPYYYGWVPEVQIDENSQPNYQKHFSMGRFSHELAYVMPDQKTVYLSDDGTNVGLYLFIADKPQDLSSGTLYAAQWQQTSSQGLGAANLKWISLGHANNQQIRDFVKQKMSFSQLFQTAERNSTGQCPAHFHSVNTTYGSECLQLKDINQDQKVDEEDEVIASRLETRRMAAYKGATTEFRKEEGVTFNPQTNQLYIGMSEIALGMENHAELGLKNSHYDLGGGNHIQLAYNPCGGVYQLDVKPNSEMHSDYIATNMQGMIAGTPKTYPADSKYSANQCDINGLANPDNLSFLDGSNSLIIAEDSDLHENNFVWSYDIYKQSLTRIFSAPVDAENTSPFWHKDVNGFAYITVVTQHPLKKQDVNPALKQSQAGVIGPIKLQ
jgi:secreted PhoX family phosphatase